MVYIKTSYTKTSSNSKEPKVMKATGGFEANIQHSSDVNSPVLRTEKGYFYFVRGIVFKVEPDRE